MAKCGSWNRIRNVLEMQGEASYTLQYIMKKKPYALISDTPVSKLAIPSNFLKNYTGTFRFSCRNNLAGNCHGQCWGSGSAFFWASRIRTHQSAVQIRIQILPFFLKGVERTEIKLAKQNFSTKFSQKINFVKT
jgi:hypothetical protein